MHLYIAVVVQLKKVLVILTIAFKMVQSLTTDKNDDGQTLYYIYIFLGRN